MAKALQFEGLGIDFSAEITKVDRKKLYGYSVVNVTDNEGKKCSLATLSDDGTHILPSGTTGLVKLDSKGNYLPKTDIQVIDAEGNLAEKKSSSFNQPVTLRKAEGIEDYLDLNVKSIYQLSLEDDVITTVRKILDEHKVLQFEFAYRDAYNEDDAFLISTKEAIFMVIGTKVEFDYLSLENIEPDTDDEEEDEDDLDFAMM